MVQEIIVYIIVVACFAYAVKHFLSFFKKRKEGKPGCGCGCGCSGCKAGDCES